MNSQFRFSTDTVLLTVAMNTMYLGISKAFAIAPNEKIMRKVRAYGIGADGLRRIRERLTDREKSYV